MLHRLSRPKRRALRSLLTAALLSTLASTCRASSSDQQTQAEPAAREWVQAAANNELGIIAEADLLPLRYQVRKVDAKGDTTRQMIESREGNVARLIARNGEPLTAAEDAAERQRLQADLDAPDAFLRHARHDRAARPYATELVRLMPTAMLWSFAPAGAPGTGDGTTQVVLDFTPDPHFKPPSLVAEALTGIAGRVWIDKESRCVTRIQGRILHPVDFGWGGVFARINGGGTVALEQLKATDRRWVYSHLEEHLSIREVLVRTVAEDTVMTLSDVHPLPSLIGFQAALHSLLALQVPLR